LVPALILEGPEPPSAVPESGFDAPELDPEPEEDPDPELEPEPEPDPEPELDPDPAPELESTPPSAPPLELLEEELPQAARTLAVRRATRGEVPVRLVAMCFSLAVRVLIRAPL
jgi:hypothetical protein